MRPVSWIFALALTGCAVQLPNNQVEKNAFTPDARPHLTGLRITDAITGTVEISKAGENWTISESGFPVDSEKINPALELIFNLAGQQKNAVGSTKNQDDVEAYGLTLDRAKIVDLIFGKHEMRLRLGMAGENFETTYWSRENEDGIFQADNNRAWGLSAMPDYWKSRNVIPKFGPGNDLKELSVSWIDSSQKSQSYRLVRVGLDSAMVIGQDTLGVTPLKAVELIGRARQLLADDFPLAFERERLDSARLENSPLVSVEIVLENGERLSTYAFKGDAEHYYAANPSGHLVKVLKWRFKALMVSNASLTSGIQLGPEEDDGTESYKVAPGFGIFMPHFHSLKEKADQAKDEQGDPKHDHDHAEGDHGH